MIQLGNSDINAIIVGGEFITKVDIGTTAIQNMNIDNFYLSFSDNYTLEKLKNLGI